MKRIEFIKNPKLEDYEIGEIVFRQKPYLFGLFSKRYLSIRTSFYDYVQYTQIEEFENVKKDYSLINEKGTVVYEIGFSTKEEKHVLVPVNEEFHKILKNQIKQKRSIFIPKNTACFLTYNSLNLRLKRLEDYRYILRIPCNRFKTSQEIDGTSLLSFQNNQTFELSLRRFKSHTTKLLMNSDNQFININRNEISDLLKECNIDYKFI